ncbi:UNVERIFIED_CONTAM: hypothetical protein K2H54_046722 [Gekko kuhli]
MPTGYNGPEKPSPETKRFEEQREKPIVLRRGPCELDLNLIVDSGDIADTEFDFEDQATYRFPCSACDVVT